MKAQSGTVGAGILLSFRSSARVPAESRGDRYVGFLGAGASCHVVVDGRKNTPVVEKRKKKIGTR